MFGLILAITCPLSVSAATAESWPAHSITLIVPYAAGGSMDVAARIYARELSPRLKQAVVIENRSGANGAIGMTFVAKAKPDGYTLVVGGSGPVTFNKMLHKTLPYDPDTEFTPIILTTETPNVLAVDPHLPINNLKELVGYARTKNGGLTVGHGGIGGIEYLAAVLFLAKEHLNGVLISYGGTAPLVTDLLGGHIDIGFPTYVPQVSSLKVLNIASAARAGFLPNVPTLRESGLDLLAATWNGIMGPASIPQDVVMKVNAAMNDALKDQAVKKEFETLGAEPLGGSAQDFVRLMDTQKALWAPVITAEKISLD
jgi:tripartite-type tricarboxylate transporter receptor subunit TctC